jgi:hypothetical protein
VPGAGASHELISDDHADNSDQRAVVPPTRPYPIRHFEPPWNCDDRDDPAFLLHWSRRRSFSFLAARLAKAMRKTRRKPEHRKLFSRNSLAQGRTPDRPS